MALIQNTGGYFRRRVGFNHAIERHAIEAVSAATSNLKH